MDVLASAYDSDEPTDERDEEESQESTKINFEESSSVFQAISQRCTPDSAPRVADKVKNVYSLLVASYPGFLGLALQCRQSHCYTYSCLCIVELQISA